MTQLSISRSLPPLCIEVEGEGLSLRMRPLDATDSFVIRKAIESSGEHLRRFMPWAHLKPSFEESAAFFAQWRADYFSGKGFNLGIFDKKGDSFLGVIGLIRGYRLNTNCWEVVYWVAKEHAKRGVGTLALKTIILLSFNCFDVDRLGVTCLLENRASRALVEKCGFVLEGELRNYLQNPSEEMVKNGYSKGRTVQSFSMIPEDCKKLPWAKEMKTKMRLTPIQGESLLLSRM